MDTSFVKSVSGPGGEHPTRLTEMQVISKDNVVRSPLPDINIPECDIWTFVSGHFKQNGNKIAVHESSSNKAYTFNEIIKKTEAIGSYLLRTGYNGQTPVCIYMQNCIEYILILMTVWRIGGKVVCLSSQLTVGEIKKAIKELSSEYLFCDKSTVEKSLQCTENIREIFTADSHPKCRSITSLFNESIAGPLPGIKINPRSDVALILYSSGTTGLPKAVEITHRGIVAQSRIVGGPEMECLPHLCGIVYQPFAHIYGITLCTIQMAYGVKTIIMKKFELEKYLSLVEENKVDQLYIVPPIVIAFTRSNLAHQFNLSHVRGVSSGAAPLSKELEEDMKRLLPPGVQVKQSWGMTELVSMGLTTPGTEICHKIGLSVPQGSAGVPIPNVRMKVIDVHSGQSLGPGQTGEVCAKADHFMKAYYKNPKATADTLDQDGWLHTGDVGYYDKNGCFFIVDKIKEVIKYNGYQVAPAELEAVLLTHPGIADAGVTGIADFVAGEIPHAWVVLKPGFKVSQEDIVSYVNSKVAPYKWIRAGVKCVDNIPKTESGKILRRKIKQLSTAGMKSKI